MGSPAARGFFFAMQSGRGMETSVSGKVEGIRMELKYCQGCGALRLRRCGNNGAYCMRCERVMAGMPRPDRAKPTEGRRP